MPENEIRLATRANSLIWCRSQSNLSKSFQQLSTNRASIEKSHLYRKNYLQLKEANILSIASDINVPCRMRYQRSEQSYYDILVMI